MRFEEHVRRALDEVPPELAEALENVAVVVEEEAPGDPDLFGLWESSFSLTHPDQAGGVAFAAHVGGFVFGVLTIKVFQVRPPLPPRRSI